MKHQHKPPRLAEKLFGWYCHASAMEDLHGDLEELFYNDLENMSARRARWNYRQRVVSLLFSYAVKKRRQKASYHHYSFTSFHPAMLKNYFLIATRNLAKHKLFAVINALGLAVGMSIGLLLIALLSFLWHYDTFHINKDRIYRVVSYTNDKRSTRPFATAPAPVAQALHDGLTGVEEVVRINSSLEGEATYKEKDIPLRGYYTEPNFLRVFTFPLIKGSIAAALTKPNSMIMTETAAAKMFGDEDPVGKVIAMQGHDFEVTGVLKDHPKNSHMQFEVLASYQTLLQRNASGQVINTWYDPTDSYVYLLLPQQHDISAIENYINKVSAPIYAQSKDFKAQFALQALNDIAPGPDMRYQIGPEWDYASLGIFIFLVILILLPACFNYANISISRALRRMKEIGLRKTMGGQRSQIFIQFVVEAMVITMIALVLSYYIFTVVRFEFVNMLVDSSAVELTPDLTTIIYFVGFALFVGFVAGIVPAVYFAKLTPVQALKTQPVSKGLTAINFRRVLIVSQFALSLGFIMSVVIVFNQYRHTLNHNFGFDQENILDVELQGTDPQIFRNEFAMLPAAQSISMSSGIMGTGGVEAIWIKENAVDSLEVYQMFIDEKYIANLNLTLLAGNNFSQDMVGNKGNVIVNEEFLKTLKLASAAEAIGQVITLTSGEEVTVVGVLKNFHYTSLREPIRNFFFRYDPARFEYANIKMVTTDAFSSISEMEATWKTFAGDKKFTAKFFDDEISDAYSSYFGMIKICGFLGLLAITISCLGLLGMVVFTVENRVKEIGVRKVMGASASSVIVLLSKDFMKLMVIAAIIAIPITYLLFEKVYLNLQYYHADIGVLDVALSLFIMLSLGVVTILSQTVRAAKANPVDSLRHE
jgi:ABC-type antimicrobial peptide transport system permease subunit